MAIEHNPVGWFEIPVTDLERAKEFYEYVFGFEMEIHEMGPVQMAWFPMIEGSIGAAGALVKGETYEPSRGGALIYITAPDIEATLARAAEKGGKVLTPRTSIGDHGFIGHFEDCEGNRIGLHSARPPETTELA